MFFSGNVAFPYQILCTIIKPVVIYCFWGKLYDPLEYSTLKNAAVINNIGVHKFILTSDGYAHIYDCYAHKSELDVRKAEIRM